MVYRILCQHKVSLVKQYIATVTSEAEAVAYVDQCREFSDTDYIYFYERLLAKTDRGYKIVKMKMEDVPLDRVNWDVELRRLIDESKDH